MTAHTLQVHSHIRASQVGKDSQLRRESDTEGTFQYYQKGLDWWWSVAFNKTVVQKKVYPTTAIYKRVSNGTL